MLTALALPRLLGRSRESLTRAGAVTARNITALRRSGYWLVLVSGIFEPMLYLFSIGIGVGGLMPELQLDDGTTVKYATFVAPAMLAVSAMNAAMSETTYNFFAKLKWAKTYDAMVSTPLRPFEIAAGELMWALLRGAFYAAVFLGVMLGLGLTTLGWVLPALLASVMIGFVFGGLGMVASTMIESWQDYDYLSVAQFALFLFSATFVPLGSYPVPLQVVVEALPLYHGVELVRALTLGRPDWATLIHVAYLLGVGAIAITIAARRLQRVLSR